MLLRRSRISRLAAGRPLPKHGRQAMTLLAREIGGMELVGGGHGRSAPDAVLKLADVAREVALRQDIDGVRTKGEGVAVFFRVLIEEVHREFGNVAGAVSRGGRISGTTLIL